MTTIPNHVFDFNENLFLLKSLKCFKLIDLGVSLLDHEDNQQQKLKMEINKDNNFSSKEISPENFNTITSFNDKVIIIKDHEFEDAYGKNSADSKNIFEKIFQAYGQVFNNKALDFNLVYKNFYGIIHALINDYDNCEYSKFFIKMSKDSVQFKSEAELRRDQSWCHVASLFLKNYESKKLNINTLDDNLLKMLDVDMNDQKNEPSKAMNLQNDLANKDMNNKGFFTTPTSPSWINNFLANESTNQQKANDNMFLPTDMRKDDSKRNSLASSNSRGNSHNPPPPSIAGSSGFDFSNPNTLMGSRAINEIQSSLMNLQHINTLNFNDNDMLSGRNNDDFAIDTSHQASDNEELNQAYMKTENFNNTYNTQNNDLTTNESTNKKSSKKANTRRFTSSASSSALNKDKNDIKNSIYQQQLENLKKISNRSATIFKGKLANQNTSNALDSLLKNTKNNLNKHQNSDFGAYDADIEKQIQEQIMSNAALNSLYEDNTNLDRFADLLTNPDEAYQNAQLKNTLNGRPSRRHYGNRMADISFERLHNSPVQFKQVFESDDIHTIPENSVPEAMQNNMKNINKAFSAPMSKNNSGNKFNFVTKKQLKQNQQRRKLQKAEQENGALYYGVPGDSNLSLDAARNAILNNNNYASVMGYLNHLNNSSRMVNGMDFNKRNNIDYELSAYKESHDNYLRNLEGKIDAKDKRILDLEKKMESMKNEIDWLRSVVTKDMHNHDKEESKKQQDTTTEHSPLDPFHLGKDDNINSVLKSEEYGSGNKDIPMMKQKPKFKFAFKIKKGNDRLAAWYIQFNFFFKHFTNRYH